MPKKKIVALSGASSTGKTTTLNITLQTLMSMPGVKLMRFERLGKTKRSRDFIAILLLFDNLHVGITSQGDQLDHVKRSTQSLIDEGCDIILCANHPSTKRLDAVRELVGRRYSVEKLSKHKAPLGEEQRQNAAMASLLLWRVFDTTSNAALALSELEDVLS